MHHLLSGRHVEHLKIDYRLTHPITSVEKTLAVQGNALLQPSKYPQPDGKERYLPYSKLLIDTIIYCLAFDPSERLSAADLVRTTQNTLAIYNQMAIYGPPLANYPYSVVFQPNAAPQNQALIGKNPPPHLNLHPAGTRGHFEYQGGRLVVNLFHTDLTFFIRAREALSSLLELGIFRTNQIIGCESSKSELVVSSSCSAQSETC